MIFKNNSTLDSVILLNLKSLGDAVLFKTAFLDNII